MAYTDQRIPAGNLIGEPGRGLAQILSVLELGRINIAARAVGVARAAFDAAFAYAQQRVTFGKPIVEHQAIQLKIAEMATRLEAARLLTTNAAERKMAGLRCDVEAGMAKLFASETALELATEAMRIHGGTGYTTDTPVERYYRDAPLMVIGEGTNEIQKLVIARGLLARGAALGRGRPTVGQLPEHLVGVLPEVRHRRRSAGPATSEKRTGPLTERCVTPELPPSISTMPSLARSWGSSTTSAGVWAGAHHTPSRSKRSAQTARGCSAMISSMMAMISARWRRMAEASAKRGILGQVGTTQGPADRIDVPRRLEAREEEPAAVGGTVRVHQRRLVALSRFGACDLAQGHLQAEVPAQDVGARPQQRDLDDAAPARGPLLEHGGEDARTGPPAR